MACIGIALRRLFSGVVGAFATVAFIPLSSAYADCTQWDVSGEWRLDQNNGYWIDMTLEQVGSQLKGDGQYVTKEKSGGGGFPEVSFGGKGELEGNVDGNSISIIAHWKEGGIGEYTGTVSPQGWLEGDTKDRMHPEYGTWHWTSVDKKATCLDVATTPAPPPPAPASPLDQAGVLKKPGMGGDIFKKTTTPVTPPPPPPPQVTVLLDVDVCASPAGCDENTRLGVLPAGTEGVTLVESQKPEYHVKWPGPEGWVYSGPGYVSLKLP
jgi:hypothetical protein